MTERKLPKLFIIADAGVSTGFANVTHNLVQELHELWEIYILGINYRGDPHPIQRLAHIYNPASKMQNDYYGIHRVADLINFIKPDLILLINDPWVGAEYIQLIEKFPVPKIIYTPIDAKDVDPDYVLPLNKFDHVIAYTEFGKRELIAAGLTAPINVIPHGVDTQIYRPVNKLERRVKNHFGTDWFIVNVTDRNQIRKRIDLAMYAFSEWVKTTNKPSTVKLHYHGAMRDEGWDILKLAKRFGLSGEELSPRDRFIITAPNISAQDGLPIELMPYVYGVADVGLSSTLGEGWGMTTHERMAMRIPMIVPNSSALGEWAKGGVHYIDISEEPFFNIGGLNTRGAVPSVKSMINALEKMYTDKQYRQQIALNGYKLATQPIYKWSNIAIRFQETFIQVMEKYTHGERHSNAN